MVEEQNALGADFHTHSTASDGTLAPGELIEESVRRGLSHVALTDHDTVAGVAEAVTAGQRLSVAVIPGVELSAHVRRGELHILGYGIDPAHPKLLEQLERLRDARTSRAATIVERLAEHGIQIEPDELEQREPGESVGRPHIARALVSAGHAKSVQEAFDVYLTPGQPAYVPSALLEPQDAIRLIRESGGLAVMAHPFSVPDPDVLAPKLVEFGLAGLECFYGEYTPAQRAALAELAERHGLLKTGGSDYHGPAFREGRELGSVRLPVDVIEAFLDAVER